MRFFRRRSEIAVLALVALAFQMLLSFGHSHARPLLTSNAPVACRTALPALPDEQCPRHSESDCEICWSISVASTAVLAVAPAPALPAQMLSADPVVRASLVVHGSPASAFQPRGPPEAA